MTSRHPRSVSKSPEPKPASPSEPATTNATVRSGETAEERERRRERLLAGREKRLSKIVSSVGGSNFTPPPTASPANIVRAAPVNSNGEKPASYAAAVRSRPAATSTSEQPPAPNNATLDTQIAPVNGCEEKKQTFFLVVISVGAIIAGYSFLGKDCFKAAVSSISPLPAACADKVATARLAYFGLLIAAILPIVIGHGRRGDYIALFRSAFTALCLCTFLLIVGSNLLLLVK